MINDKQFYITKQQNKKFEDWEKISLTNGFSVYYQSQINIHHYKNDIILLGYAWQVDPLKKSPQKELLDLCQKEIINHEDIYQIEKTWCGRYVLIVGDWLFLDTIGSLGIFYDEKNTSSSLNIICELENLSYIDPQLEYRKIPDYFPGINTPYEGICRLMPSQILNYTKCETKNRPLLIDKISFDQSEESLIKDFSSYFINSVKNIIKLFPNHKIWLALTAGRDSRVTMSLFEKAGIDYSIFTLWHNCISYADQDLPKQMAKAINREYKYISRNKREFSTKRFEEYRKHTAGLAQDADWLFYSYNQYQKLRENNNQIILIRSGIWEIPQEFLLAEQKKKDYLEIFPYMKEKECQYKSFMEWLEMVKKDNINSNISFPVRLSWDISQGCWLSSIEQSFDLMEGIVSIQPFNCRLFVGLLMGFNERDRKYRFDEEKITLSNCPTIAKFPYDYQYVPKLKKIIWHRIQELFSNR